MPCQTFEGPSTSLRAGPPIRVVVAALVCWTAAACGESPPPAGTGAGRPDIILISVPTDPNERENVVGHELDQTARLRDVLSKVLGSAAARGEALQGEFAPIPPRVLERLKALGYVQ
jgi:hypothetical protein